MSILFKEKENKNLVKKSKIIAQQPKTIEYPSIVDINLSIVQHPKTSYKLSKTIKQAEKVSEVGGADNYLYSETKNSENFLNEKNAKITKWSHAYRGYPSTYNVAISNSFSPKQQLKYTESATKNKLISSLSRLKGFKFITTLVLELKKIKNDDERTFTFFYFNSKAKTAINESDIDDVFESIYATIISNIQKTFWERFW